MRTTHSGFRWLVAFCMLQALVLESRAAPPASGALSTERRAIGANVGTVKDWDPTQLFADVMKQARLWGTPAQPWVGGVAVDAAGWPTEDAGAVFMVGIPKMAGTYRLTYRGNATAETHSTADRSTKVRNRTYDPTTNLTTADVVVGPQESNLFLVFRGQAGGVKDVKLMRPGHDPSEVFNREFLARLVRFQALRFMDFSSTNGNAQVNWSDRILPTNATQQQRPDGKDVGAAWEYVILLANLAGKDAWITVPHLATNDYVVNLARLFRYGSDGVNPYGSPQANPVYPPLDPGRKLYVEWSNELWNGSFSQSRWLQARADAALAARDPELTYGGTTNRYEVMFRMVGRRTGQVSDIFRSVFGDGQMMTRVRPVLAGQLANTGTFTPALEYLRDRRGGAANLVYGIAGAPYFRDFGSDTRTDLTLDLLFSEMTRYSETDLLRWTKSSGALAARHRLKFLAYEGGQHLVGTGGLEVKAAAQLDPRMKELLVQNFANWFSSGGGLFMYYSLCSGWGRSGYWGLSKDISSEATPKWEAVDAVLRESPGPEAR